MIEHLHQHLLSELDRSGRADTIFVVCAVLLDLLVLAVNSSLANSSRPGAVSAIYTIFASGAVVITVTALIALINGLRIGTVYHHALMRIYQDHKVADYYPAQALGSGRLRLVLYIIVVVAAGVLAILIPNLLKGW